MEFLKLKSSLEACFFIKSCLYSNVYDAYLFLEIRENENTEYLTPTYYLNNHYANVIKFAMFSSNSTQCKERRKTKN